MPNLTVRESFEKAGHPVPEGAKLYHVYSNWFFYTAELVAVFYEHVWPDAPLWMANQRRKDTLEPNTFDLSNLPAKDAYSALPDVVKAVVEEV